MIQNKNDIRRRIFSLRAEIETYLRIGDTEEVERRRDEISQLERQLLETGAQTAEKSTEGKE
jgi:protein-arginine kinase activator protein McsA